MPSLMSRKKQRLADRGVGPCPSAGCRSSVEDFGGCCHPWKRHASPSPDNVCPAEGCNRALLLATCSKLILPPLAKLSSCCCCHDRGKPLDPTLPTALLLLLLELVILLRCVPCPVGFICHYLESLVPMDTNHSGSDGCEASGAAKDHQQMRH